MGDLFGVNDYKMTDLVFYVGLFGGFILTYRAMQSMTDMWLVQMLVGGGVGLVLGWGLTFVYSALSASERADRGGEE